MGITIFFGEKFLVSANIPWLGKRQPSIWNGLPKRNPEEGWRVMKVR
jgi:hypothetical protein